jgi:carboxyl-terminal processing protease
MSFNLRTSITLAVGMALGASLSLSYSAWAGRTGPNLSWQAANLFAEVYERVRRDYLEEIPEDSLMAGAVRGMVGTLDPFSSYMDPKEFEELRIDASGQYSGVGVEISLKDGDIRIVSALDNSPAAVAGIRGGDTIVAIDDLPVDPENLNGSVERLRGQAGAAVKLTVARPETVEPLQFQLTRRKVLVHSVKGEMLETGYAYVRIAQFSETTAQEFAAELKQLQSKSGESLQGLVLDLRNNPGGILEAAVDVADEFLEDGVIVTADGRTSDARFAMNATPGDAMRGAPVVVLVNGGSASASEIVAGALKDRNRGVLVGQKTYGKGSVQSISPLSNGGALKLTTSHYHTPSGAMIHKRGIEPDVAFGNLANAPEAPAAGSKLLREDAELRMALERVKKESRPTVKPATDRVTAVSQSGTRAAR